MNNLILFMTLTGSLPLLFYCLIRFLFKERISSGCLKVLLYLSMLFFLVPFPLLSTLLRSLPMLLDHSALYSLGSQGADVVNVFAGILNQAVPAPASQLSPDKALLISDGAMHLPRYSLFFSLLTLVWAGGFILSLGRICLSYRSLKKILNRSSVYEKALSVRILFFKRTVEIRIAQSGKIAWMAPFSTGFLHPLIVLPEGLAGDERLCVLLHELSHIRHMDLLTRLPALLIRALHWFNPLACLLLQEIKAQQEFRADEAAMGQLDRELQKKYGTLVLNALTRTPLPSKKAPNLLSAFGTSGYLAGKERIRRLKDQINGKHRKRTAAILVVSAAAVIAIPGNCLAIMAYQPPYIITDREADGAEYLRFYAARKDYFYPQPIRIDLSEQFTLSRQMETDYDYPQGLCPHCWLMGTVQTHRKQADGSCDVITSSAVRCILCGAVSVGEEKISSHCEKCPH